MCIPKSKTPAPAPPPPAAPAVLDQKAPKKAKRDDSVEDRKRKGLKAYRSDLTISGVGNSTNTTNDSGTAVNIA